MKKNKNLIYLLLLGAAAVAFMAFKKKPKLKGKVIVPDLETITKEQFETETQPEILIREIKEAVESTPEPMSTILKKAKGLFKKPIKKLKPTKSIFVKELSKKIDMPVLNIPPPKAVKQSKKVIKKAKKRVKGFDDISVLY